jgi:hypothetical protein
VEAREGRGREDRGGATTSRDAGVSSAGVVASGELPFGLASEDRRLHLHDVALAPVTYATRGLRRWRLGLHQGRVEHPATRVKEALAGRWFTAVREQLDAVPSGPLRADLVAYARRRMEDEWPDAACSPAWGWRFWEEDRDRPWLPLVRRIELEECGVGPEEIRWLVSCAALRGLRELIVHWGNVGDEGAAVLGAPENLPRLCLLNLINNRLGDRAVAGLFGRGWGRALRHLRLDDNRFTPDGVAALARQAALRHLVRLDLSAVDVGPAGAAALGRSPTLHALETLDLRGCGLGDEGLAALSSGLLARLRHLDLDGNGIGADGACALIRGLHAQSPLEVLSLAGNPLGDDGVFALARAPMPESLRVLHLGAVGMTDAGGHALRRAPWWTQLTSLHVSDETLSDEVQRQVQRGPAR